MSSTTPLIEQSITIENKTFINFLKYLTLDIDISIFLKNTSKCKITIIYVIGFVVSLSPLIVLTVLTYLSKKDKQYNDHILWCTISTEILKRTINAMGAAWVKASDAKIAAEKELIAAEKELIAAEKERLATEKSDNQHKQIMALLEDSKNRGICIDDNYLHKMQIDLEQKMTEKIKQDICNSVIDATKKVFDKQRYDLEPLLTTDEKDHTINISRAD